MKIQNVIDLIVSKHYHDWLGKSIHPDTTRDQILYGDPTAECTGVVTAIYASVDVIKKAADLGANLIVAHESLFWNHGDHTDWLTDNKTFQMKRQLLEEYNMVVWRDHDHIHAGVDWDGKRVDGIFYGLLEQLGWQSYLKGELCPPMVLEIPKMPMQSLTAHLMDKLHLKGIKCVGDMNGTAHRLLIPNHVIGRDNGHIELVDRSNIDTVLAMELIDYTLGIYIRDSAMLQQNKRILAVGHFNMEEPGMRWFGEVYLPTILPESLAVWHIPSGDLYDFVIKEEH